MKLALISKDPANSRFRIKYILLAFCIVLLCHSGTLNLMGKYLGTIYQEKIENHYIGDTKPLFNGTIRFKDAVNQNIKKLLIHDWGVKFFNLKINILITSENGEVVYPFYDSSGPNAKEDNGVWDNSAIATKNFNLLHEKRKLIVVTRLGYISPASFLILFFYLFIAFILFLIINKTREKLLLQYRSQGKIIVKFKEEEKKLKEEEKKLKTDHGISKKKLQALEQQRKKLIEQLNAAETEQSAELKKARTNEDEMINEIDFLEKQLNKNIAMQKIKEQEIHDLKKQVARYERRKGKSGKRGEFDLTEKRFSTLYKNVSMNRRALTGFLELNDNQQIKAEEIVHQLNHNPGKIVIKRKVFSGKKDKNTVFEVLFAYNGRLYFRNLKGKRIEILVIGTKNTQGRDMEFLRQF